MEKKMKCPQCKSEKLQEWSELLPPIRFVGDKGFLFSSHWIDGGFYRNTFLLLSNKTVKHVRNSVYTHFVLCQVCGCAVT